MGIYDVTETLREVQAEKTDLGFVLTAEEKQLAIDFLTRVKPLLDDLYETAIQEATERGALAMTELQNTNIANPVDFDAEDRKVLRAMSYQLSTLQKLVDDVKSQNKAAWECVQWLNIAIIVLLLIVLTLAITFSRSINAF